MSTVMQINPYEFFVDGNGDALDDGYIYIGEPNKFPPSFPVAIYYDSALLTPAANPLRTSNGYIVRNGSPTFLYISGNYSILVRDKNGNQVFYVPDFLMTGSGTAVSSGDLANQTDPLKGAGLVGYKTRTLYEKLDADAVSPSDYGAVGDGVADDTAFVNSALASGKPVKGDVNAIYGVSGNIILPAITRMSNISFKQLDPNSATRRTLHMTAGTLCHMYRVKVDKSGTGSEGSLLGAAGIYINSCDVVILDEPEVTGNGYGNGIVTADCGDVVYDTPYIHDMTHGTPGTSNPGDDRIQGIWSVRGKSTVIKSPIVRNLLGQWSGQAPINRWSRGIAVSGSSSITILAPQIDNVDQGIDLSGDENPRRFSVVGGSASNCYTWGFKSANSVQDGSFLGCVAFRCGISGFVASAPTPAMPNKTGRIDYIGCRSIETGSGGVHFATSAVAGFRVMSTGTFPDYPRSIRFIGCLAIASSSVCKFGFLSDAVLGGDGDQWVEAINCSAEGGATALYYGFNQGITKRVLTSAFSVPNGAYTDVPWDSTLADRQGSSGANSSEFRIRRQGMYLVTCGVEFSGNATGTRGLRILQGGSTVQGSTLRFSAVDANQKALCVSCIVLCNTGDIIKAQALQESGGALNLVAGGGMSVALIDSGMGA